MRKAIQLPITLVCFALCGASVPAAFYWDSNGTADGAGTTPTGTWGIDAFWNATDDGTTTSPTAWVSGEDAVFSAGTDATDPFTVTINGTQAAGNLTVEEGTLTISGGTALNVGGAVAGKGIIDIASDLTTTISTVLTGGDDTGQITKTGNGTLILNSPCTHSGATTIAGGTLKLGASELLSNASDLSIAGTRAFDMNNFSETIDGLFGAGTVLNGGTLTVGQNNKFAATFSGLMYDGSSPMTLVKVGTGTQTLAGTTFYSGLTIVSAGVLELSDGDAVGSYSSPTIVSNGAVLQLNVSSVFSEQAILNGSGIANGGALRCISGSPTWGGGVILGSDARINHDGGGTWNWQGSSIGIDGTTAGGVFNVTFGGNGGTIQLKNGYRTIVLSNAPIYKDGTSTLRFETPCVGVTACHLDGGYILTRTAFGGNFMAATSPIYVGAGAGGFDTGLNFSPDLNLSMVLASGANPWFNIRPNTSGTPQTWKQNAVISGLGGLSKTNVGTLFLNKANTYSGNTTIQWGPLTLGAIGSISNSPVIDVQSTNSIFNVTSNASGFVLGTAQTLKGDGTILGNVTAIGTISPGASVGSLTNDGNLTLAMGAKLLIDVDKALAPSNDVITVTGTLNSTGTGTVTVMNLNPGMPLAVGDSFQIFNQAVANGQTMTVSGGGATWTNNLAVDGSIAVVAILAPPATIPRMTSVTVGGTPTVRVAWTNVIVGSNYWLQYNTNLNTTNWHDLVPVTAWDTTASQVDGTPAGTRQRYYRVRFLTSGEPPATKPRITSVAFPGTIAVTVNYTNTVAGISYVVQYRTNLNTTNWTSLSPVTASGTASATTDSFPTGSGQRYYRVYGQF